MATLKNTTCVKLENVVKSGVNVFGRYDLYVKGEWLPTEFSLSICDGTRAWTVTASKDLIQSCADELTEHIPILANNTSVQPMS
jgi:hypothetical protein